MKSVNDLRGLLWQTGGPFRRNGDTTSWFDESGIEWHAYPLNDDVMHLYANAVTPEQAIEITLSRNTCRVLVANQINDLFVFKFSCGHIMVNPFNDIPNYCPWCRAKVINK